MQYTWYIYVKKNNMYIEKEILHDYPLWTIFHKIRITYCFKTNRTHCFPSKIRTVHPIYRTFSGNHISFMHGISYQFHHHILKIVEMQAVWKKSGKSGFCEKVACSGWLFESETDMFLNISNTNWVIIKYHSLKEAEIYGVLFDTSISDYYFSRNRP